MLFDVTRLVSRLIDGKRPTGVDRVSLAYLTCFRADARALVRHLGRWIMFSPPQSQRIFANLLGETDNPAGRIRRIVALGHLQQVRAPLCNAVLFNTGHIGLDDPDYAVQVKRYGLRPFYFLHDLIPISHPEYCRDGEAERHQRRLMTMLQTGRGLIANSADTFEALRDFARGHGLELPPVIIAPIGTVSLPPPPPAPPLESERPYFVMLGTIEPRKNHLLLLNVWRRIVEAARQTGTNLRDIPRLVLIGQRGWEFEQVLDLLERCPSLPGHVIELPSCDDIALSSWLHHARALLFPSFVEGFGMPLVEALAHGVPVIASDLGVFREIAGAVPDYVDPLDGPGWISMIRDYSRPGSLCRAAQIERLSSFQPPRWSTHFELVTGFVQSISAEASLVC